MIKIKNLHKSFNRNTSNQIDVFNGFDLEIQAKETLALIGSNGSGKSTLMNIISGALEADSGQVTFTNEDMNGNGKEIDLLKLSEIDRAREIGKVIQDPTKSVAPSLTILENMALADNKARGYGFSFLVDKSRVEYFKSLLKPLDLGLENMMESKASLLSGGQRQSLSLVMSTMNKPKLLLLDEHTASLDPKTSHLIMNKTKELIKSQDMTTIMITHNMRDAINFSDRVVMLKEGQIVFDERSENITEEDLNKLYLNLIV